MAAHDFSAWHLRPGHLCRIVKRYSNEPRGLSVVGISEIWPRPGDTLRITEREDGTHDWRVEEVAPSKTPGATWSALLSEIP